MITPKTQNIDIERSILVRYKFRNQNLAKSNICSSTERNFSNGCINTRQKRNAYSDIFLFNLPFLVQVVLLIKSLLIIGL